MSTPKWEYYLACEICKAPKGDACLNLRSLNSRMGRKEANSTPHLKRVRTKFDQLKIRAGEELRKCIALHAELRVYCSRLIHGDKAHLHYSEEFGFIHWDTIDLSSTDHKVEERRLIYYGELMKNNNNNNGFENTSTKNLKILRTNLIKGLDLVAKSIADGTFHQVGPKGSAPPAQGGQITLIFFYSVTNELIKRGEL